MKYIEKKIINKDEINKFGRDREREGINTRETHLISWNQLS